MEAAADLASRKIPFELLIVGDGEMRATSFVRW